ncbi:N-alpha-acetyltransferase 40 [Colletotrichum spinosum]|uniref:N-alpha-acetyltransferase 40 n=1 Tax=Colletotrichum spinosum TaxID=1347390 RepID=A0A4R8PMH1_9PEZI|nr:N-alpha-acetyltransferase 40 [Colletotrichum spinosum]
MAPGKRRRAPTNPIEAANRKSDEEFIRDHLQPSEDWTSWTHPTSEKTYSVALKSPSVLSTDEIQACFDMVEYTSGADYRGSEDGWKPAEKIKEMRSPELRYILVKDDEEKVCGFTSMMPTFEEGQPVVYCYEIHLLEGLRGTGIGQKLMGYQVKVAQSIPLIEKVMLTCFLANERARKFYEALGFKKDAISPAERKLRSGRVFVPDYLIMSKRVRVVSEAPVPKRTAKKTKADAEKGKGDFTL